MSVTIESLDIQIRSSAGSAANNIDRLATALGNLKANAGLTKAVNNLNKLSAALIQLQQSSTGLQNIRGLAGAMKALASVPSAGGLNSVLNSLKKVPAIVAALNPEQITAFSMAMRQLADGLRPLATQIDQVARSFGQLPARVTQCVSAVNRMTRATRTAEAAEESHQEAINSKSLNLASLITNVQAYYGVIQQVAMAMKNLLADAIQWDGIQFRFGRAFGEDADEVYEYVQRISDALMINQQQFMQYASLYGSLLSGFGMAQRKVTTMSVGLTELSYDIWAAYNDRFKTLEDASEAVRSAITGEIEPIRNAGIALTEASLQEYLDSVGMATVSIEKLTEAQKSEVRYAAMVKAAMSQGIVGTYAKEMQTAEGAVRTLAQQLKTLGQALGSLFIPILQRVIPWISAFVEVLVDAVQWLGALFGIKFQEISWDSGVGDALGGIQEGADEAAGSLDDASAAAKKLKDYTMGFDELNVISPVTEKVNNAAGSAEQTGSGWEGLELDTLWDESIFENASKKVNEIKEKILGFIDEFKTELIIIGTALGALGMAKLLDNLGQAIGLGDKFHGVMKNIAKLATTAIIITLQYTLMAELFDSYIDSGEFKDYVAALFVGALGTFALYSMWGKGGLVIGLAVIAAASLSAIIENGGITDMESTIVGLTGLASAIAAVGVALKKVVPILQASKLGQYVSALVGAIGGNSAASSALTMIAPTITKIGAALGTAAKAVAAFVGGLSAGTLGIIAGAIAAVASAAYFLYENWDKVVEAVKRFFNENIKPKLDEIKESFQHIKDTVVEMLPDWVIQAFEDFKEAAKGLAQELSKAWDKLKEWAAGIDWIEGIAKAFEILGGVIFSLFGGGLATLISGAIGWIKGLVEQIEGFVDILSGGVDIIVGLFTGDLQKVKQGAEKIKDGVVKAFNGMYDMTIGVVVNFVKDIIDWFTDLWDELVGHSIVPDMIDAIVEWFLSLPDKIFGPVQQFIDGIIKKFKDMWSNIQSWWNSSVAPKFTASYWQQKFDVIRSAILEKLASAKAVVVSKWNEIKSWFNSTIAPKFTEKYWMEKFETIRKAISDKLSEVKKVASTKWDDIKAWYESNVAPKFTLNFWLDKFKNLKEGFTTTIKNAINAGIDMMNKFIGWLNSHLSFSWDGLEIAGKQIFEGGSMQLFTIPTIPRLEKGGFLEDGLFTMNKGEIAGKFNNGKSVVANNQQIVDGIAAGVYQAVVSAMQQSQGRDQNVNVYLDGKQIYASVRKTESERGVSLMGNQLGYAY